MTKQLTRPQAADPLSLLQAVNQAFDQIELGFVAHGTIVNSDVAAAAAIAYSKLNLSASIVDADVSGSAAIGFSKLAHLPLRGPNDATQYQFDFGALTAVNADAGGWCNYTIAPAWSSTTDFIVAVNDFSGTSGVGILDIQIQTRTTFRAFVNAAGLNVGCRWFGIGH